MNSMDCLTPCSRLLLAASLVDSAVSAADEIQVSLLAGQLVQQVVAEGLAVGHRRRICTQFFGSVQSSISDIRCHGGGSHTLPPTP